MKPLTPARSGVITTIVSSLILILASLAVSAQTFNDPGFSAELVATLPTYTPVGMAFAPDGRIFITQKGGVVRVVKNGVLLPTPFIDISNHVNRAGDRGLLGFALDPNFATNGYAYLLYVHEPGTVLNDAGPKTARLTRVQANPANPDVALTTETVLMGKLDQAPCSNYPEGSDCIGSDSTSHTIGTVIFGPDGKLYVGMGDGSAYSGTDVNAFRAQNLNYYNGKILRLNTNGTTPTDNPFYDSTNPNSVRSKVYAYGLRNPYRFVVHPQTGEVYIGDVGFSSWEEINRGRGSNFGWPCYEGNFPQTRYQNDFPQLCAAVPSTSVTKPIYSYDHSQGNSVIGGTIYNGQQFPAQYRGNYFFADYGSGWIKRMTFDASQQITGIQTFATGVTSPVSLEAGPDGALYYIAFSTGQLWRLRYASTPVAVASASIPNFAAPYTVAFSSASSHDPGGSALTYLWEFGDGATSTSANPTHTYNTTGVKSYTVKLTVKNVQNLTHSTTIVVTVGGQPPTATILQPTNGLQAPYGTTVTFSGTASDPNEVLAPSAMSWTVLLHHDTHVHAIASTTGTGGSWVSENHGAGSYFYELVLTVTDSTGLSDTKRVNVYPVASAGSLPTPWSASDVGAVGLAGNTDYANGVFTARGAGADISGTADGFHYVYQPLNGDGEIIARVASVLNTAKGAKAGVMVRASLESNAAHALMSISPVKGVSFEWRGASGYGTALVSGGYHPIPQWVRLVRAGNKLTGYRSVDGVNWVQVGSSSVALPTTVLIGLAATSANNSALTTAVFDNVQRALPPPPNILPAPWQNRDIGVVGVAGTASHLNGAFTLKGSGDDISGTVDGFHYVYQPLNGNGEIIARVASVQITAKGAKAGVMVRAGLEANAAHALMSASPDEGASFEYRGGSGFGTALISGGHQPLPRWVRLVRNGNRLTGYHSVDGVNWVPVGSATIALPTTIQIGLATTSANNLVLTTAVLDNVKINLLTTNAPPTVSLTAPSNGATFTAPASIALAASASDSDGSISKVEFLANGQLLNTDTSAPYSFSWSNVAAGNYSLTARATDDKGAITTSSAISITVNAAVVDGTGDGLTGDYYKKGSYDQRQLSELKLVRLDPTINFDWGSGNPGSGVDKNNFSIFWDGQVQPRYSGTYTFYVRTTGAVRLWVNNQLLVDGRAAKGATLEKSGTTALTAGQKYLIEMVYYKDDKTPAQIKLEWSSSQQGREVIPRSQLYSTTK